MKKRSEVEKRGGKVKNCWHLGSKNDINTTNSISVKREEVNRRPGDVSGGTLAFLQQKFANIRRKGRGGKSTYNGRR